MEYHSAIKRDNLLIHTITWMNLKCNMLNERKAFDPIQMILWKGKIIWAENRSVVARSWNVGKTVGYQGEQGICWGDETVLYLDYGDGYDCMFVKICRTVH